MADYIKREDALKALCEDCAYKIEECNETYRCKESQIILDVPAADVRENVRGHWIVVEKENPNGIDWCHCSVCGCKDITQNISSINFCHNCGADMRPPEVKE